MAKRFTATEKWDDPWFCTLGKQEKLFWIYLLDKCDHAGIWQVNHLLLTAYFGSEFELPDYGDRVVKLSEQKWFIPKFIEFQYGELNPANRAHLSVINKLKKEGAWKVLISPFQGAKDKDKDKDMDMVKDKDIAVNEVRTPAQQIVFTFAQNRGINLDSKIIRGQFFATHIKAANELAEIVAGDMKLAELAIREIGAWLDRKVKDGVFEEWRNLKAIVNNYATWKAELDRDTKRKNGN